MYAAVVVTTPDGNTVVVEAHVPAVRDPPPMEATTNVLLAVVNFTEAKEAVPLDCVRLPNKVNGAVVVAVPKLTGTVVPRYATSIADASTHSGAKEELYEPICVPPLLLFWT